MTINVRDLWNGSVLRKLEPTKKIPLYSISLILLPLSQYVNADAVIYDSYTFTMQSFYYIQSKNYVTLFF